MFLGGNSSGRAQPTISPRLLRPMCGMAQSSLRIALPKKPSGSAGRFWPNHRIHVLKAKALLFSSDYGRGFGSVFHHQYPNPNCSQLGFFLARSRRFPRVVGGSCGILRTSASGPWPFPGPPSSLSWPFFSPASLPRTRPKSAKAANATHTNQRVTRGRIKRFDCSIGRQRKLCTLCFVGNY